MPRSACESAGPPPDRLVDPGGRERAAVGAERDALDRVGVPVQDGSDSRVASSHEGGEHAASRFGQRARAVGLQGEQQRQVRPTREDRGRRRGQRERGRLRRFAPRPVAFAPSVDGEDSRRDGAHEQDECDERHTSLGTTLGGRELSGLIELAAADAFLSCGAGFQERKLGGVQRVGVALSQDPCLGEVCSPIQRALIVLEAGPVMRGAREPAVHDEVQSRRVDPVAQARPCARQRLVRQLDHGLRTLV